MSPKVLTTKDKKIVFIADVKDAPFKCSVCRKVFISEGHLLRHYDRRHPSLNVPLDLRSTKGKVSPDHALRNDQPSMNAVLNATERIECLLANLTLGDGGTNKCLLSTRTNHERMTSDKGHMFDPKEISSSSFLNVKGKVSLSDEDDVSKSSERLRKDAANKTFDLPLATSTDNEMNSDSLEDIASYLGSREFSEDEISSASSRNMLKDEDKTDTNQNVIDKELSSNDSNSSITIHGLNLTKNKNMTDGQNSGKDLKTSYLEKTYSCLDPAENEVFNRMLSPNHDSFPDIALEYDVPNDNLNSVLCDNSRRTYESDLLLHNETLMEAHHRLRSDVLSKLNRKLRVYGVDPNWQTIPEKTAFNVETLLKAEREKVSKNYPNYSRLRDLINDNANTRIKMSMES